MNFARILRHLLTGRAVVRRLFSHASLAAIEQAIKRSEIGHEGEVCFAVEAALDTLPLLRDQSARERAVELFSQLRVWDTEHNNGVLVYLLLADRDVEIIADRGINVKVSAEEWEKICREMETAFRQGHFESGVVAGIGAVGSHLRTHFRAEKGPEGRENELPDTPVIL
ncbi:TPM domain-containing protein [Nitrosospira sp. NpAV]|uniref:TPM domain-containing protein n=1 Tax=Nitrosospira sp. NpAV TaxID=58133 RepID=UPI0005A12C94|nr:TPM domain-containing protein [Nitrosospira sp. NpAV]KIO49963.1 membrane protein [Nitrosospira sp. NpAV]